MYKKLILSLFLATGALHLKGAVKLATAVQPVTQKLSMNLKLLMGTLAVHQALRIALETRNTFKGYYGMYQKIFAPNNVYTTAGKLHLALKYTSLATAGILLAPLTYTTASRTATCYRLIFGLEALGDAYLNNLDAKYMPTVKINQLHSYDHVHCKECNDIWDRHNKLCMVLRLGHLAEYALLLQLLKHQL